jgi:hypothetical protein
MSLRKLPIVVVLAMFLGSVAVAQTGQENYPPLPQPSGVAPRLVRPARSRPRPSLTAALFSRFRRTPPVSKRLRSPMTLRTTSTRTHVT